MRCNDELIGKTQGAYRKIRNTIRYLMGNISDFNPASQSVAYSDMCEVDRWAMQQLQKLICEVRANYDSFIFHRVFSLIYNFCTIEMSSIYMDVLKDRLYCDAADSRPRRSSQSAMYHILDALVRLLAPILVHTCEEAWAAIEHKSQQADSIHLAALPEPDSSIDYAGESAKWEKTMSLRDDVMRMLEGLRQDKLIASNQEASVTITTGDAAMIEILESIGTEQFAALCIVSEVKLEKTEGETKIEATKSSLSKCERCWNFWPTVGQNPNHPDLCQRCAEAVSE